MSTKLTQERLKELLHYDPETGVFTRKVPACNRWPDIGVPIGTPDGKGYLMVMLDKRRYKLHRLAFLYMTGRLPANMVDHRSGDVADNRWSNLREATNSENMQNRKLNGNNSTGYAGVHVSNGSFIARIGVSGKRLHLGSFGSAGEAGQAYKAAKSRLHKFQPVERAP